MRFSVFKLFLKDMFHRKEFFFALIGSMLVVLVPLCMDLCSFYGNDVIHMFPAWYRWGAYGGGLYDSIEAGAMKTTPLVIRIFFQFLLPFFACIAYAACHVDHIRFRNLNQIVHRTGYGAYYRSAAATVFIGGFLVIFLPLILEQLLLCISAPIFPEMNVGYNIIEDVYPTIIAPPMFLSSLQANHPYLFNLLFSVIPAVTGGVLAYCAYTFSLYFHKGRFWVLTLAGFVLWIVPPYLMRSYSEFTSRLQDAFDLSAQYINFTGWCLWMGGLLLLCIILTELKIQKMTDQLS